MFPTTFQSHLSAHNLPLRWLRVPLLLATLGLSAVCIAVGAQAIRGTMRLESNIKSHASQDGVELDFDMQDVRSVTIVLTTVAVLLATASLACITLLVSDWTIALFRYSPNDPKTRTGSHQDQPISTSSLRIQSAVLSFLTVWLFATLIPTTRFVRTRSAMITSNAPIPSSLATFADPLYWNYGFLRCLAAAPWFSFMAAFPTVLVTICAYVVAKRLRKQDIKDAVADEKGTA